MADVNEPPGSTERPGATGAVAAWLRPLAAFLAITAGCATLLAATVELTAPHIADARARLEHQAVARLLDADTAPPGCWTGDTWFLGDGHALLRGSAAGYGGPIQWMLVFDATAGTPLIQRVLVTAHQETPGIADFLNDPQHGWLTGFHGRGADAANLDTISGATITTRALTRSIGRALADAPTQSPSMAADGAAAAACVP
ncbi:MAG: FMN-binding protein [Pseudomonadales bacterium]|nr:FMN-binding protein [Pseudomonadales bacterium]